MWLTLLLACTPPSDPRAVSPPPAAPIQPADPPPPDPTTAACTPAEKTVFACTSDKGKAIAVCARPHTLQYRFGTQDTLELALPADSDPKKFALEERSYAQSMASVLSISNDGYTYEVTEAMGGGGRDAESNNFRGVYVLKGSETVATVTCAGEPIIDWSAVPK